MKAATGAGDIQLRKTVLARRLRNTLEILANDEGSATILWRQEPVAEDLLYNPAQPLPIPLVFLLINFEQEIPKDVSGLALPNQEVLIRAIVSGLLGTNPREWRNVHDRDVLGSLWQLLYMFRRRLYIDELSVLIAKLESQAPSALRS